MFGQQSPLGKRITTTGQPATIIGVIAHMQGSWVGSDKVIAPCCSPHVVRRPVTQYLVRTQPGHRARHAAVEVALRKSDPNRVIDADAKDVRHEDATAIPAIAHGM